MKLHVSKCFAPVVLLGLVTATAQADPQELPVVKNEHVVTASKLRIMIEKEGAGQGAWWREIDEEWVVPPVVSEPYLRRVADGERRVFLRQFRSLGLAMLESVAGCVSKGSCRGHYDLEGARDLVRFGAWISEEPMYGNFLVAEAAYEAAMVLAADGLSTEVGAGKYDDEIEQLVSSCKEKFVTNELWRRVVIAELGLSRSEGMEITEEQLRQMAQSEESGRSGGETSGACVLGQEMACWEGRQLVRIARWKIPRKCEEIEKLLRFWRAVGEYPEAATKWPTVAGLEKGEMAFFEAWWRTSLEPRGLGGGAWHVLKAIKDGRFRTRVGIVRLQAVGARVKE